MKQIKNSELLKGKTVERTGYLNNRFFLFFTDNTFCIISGCSGWDEYDVEFNDEDFQTEPNTSNYNDLKSIGLIDEATFLKFNKLEEQENKEYERQVEMNKLAELRKKYPDA